MKVLKGTYTGVGISRPLPVVARLFLIYISKIYIHRRRPGQQG